MDRPSLHTRRGRGRPAGTTPATPAITSGAWSSCCRLRGEGLGSILPQQASGSFPIKTVPLSLHSSWDCALAAYCLRLPSGAVMSISSIWDDRSAENLLRLRLHLA